LPRVKSTLVPLLWVVPGLGFSATTLPLRRTDENALVILPTRQWAVASLLRAFASGFP